MAGFDHTATLKLVQGLPNDRAGHTQTRCQLSFGRYLLLGSQPTIEYEALKPV